MSVPDDIARALRLPPEVPLHLTRIEVEIAYTPDAVAEKLPEERAAEMAGLAAHLTHLLRAGFLCRPGGADPSARVGVMQTAPDRVLIGYAGRGAHVNLLVIFLRMAWAFHQSPADAFDSLVAALGSEDEAREVFRDLQFPKLVAAVTAKQLAAAPGAPMRSAPDAMRALSQDMPQPTSGPLPGGAVVDAEVIKMTPGAPVPDEDMEDAWLSVAQLSLLMPPGYAPEHEPGDEYFETSKGAKTLRVEEISIEQVFLFEFLDLLSDGKLAQAKLAVS